jgi:regulator of telomere elongation helicase 1
MKAIGNSKNGKSRVAAAADAAADDGAASIPCRRRKINPLSPPTTLELSGIRIHFPFRPYQCQITYMQTVIDALLKSENALLESPTGTGKTLCLLCACLAWQRHQAQLFRSGASEFGFPNAGDGTDLFDNGAVRANNNAEQQQQQLSNKRPPTIVYASRTHSQLSQVVRELRTTRYRPNHAVLGSREQMCVHPKVKKPNCSASDINHECNKMGKERKCRFRNNLEGFSAPANEYTSTNDPNATTTASPHQPVMDMEELVAMGQKHHICPFYFTRAMVERAELILVPYNYLFDKDARETTLLDIPWDNAVVIFDEAHNLESFASESASFDISSADVAGCIAEVSKVSSCAV